jgi:hypothetical protein
MERDAKESVMRAMTRTVLPARVRGVLLIGAVLFAPNAAQAGSHIELAQEPVVAQLKVPPGAPTATIEAKVNNWTVGLAGGLPEGTILRFAAEIARNLNDGNELRVLPIVTPGATDNVKDLLYFKGVDMSIVHADVFEHFRTVEKIPNIERRIHYISALQISELHVLVRPEINSFKDLQAIYCWRVWLAKIHDMYAEFYCKHWGYCPV